MRSRHIVAFLFLVLANLALPAQGHAAVAARHRLHVGTITAISSNAVTIHSKRYATDYHFVIDGSTQFLRHSVSVPRSLFKVGSYVTVSYGMGPNNSMVAWHISLRK